MLRRQIKHTLSRWLWQHALLYVNLTKLSGQRSTSLTSADSHGMLRFDLRVPVQFWSGHFSSPERFGAVVFKHSPTHPTLFVCLCVCLFVCFFFSFHWSNQCWRVPGMRAHGWVAGICQPWGRNSIWVLAGHSGSSWIPQAPTFHLSDAAVNDSF